MKVFSQFLSNAYGPTVNGGPPKEKIYIGYIFLNWPKAGKSLTVIDGKKFNGKNLTNCVVFLSKFQT